MLRLLLKIPRWLNVALAAVAAAGVLVISTVVDNLNGWPLAAILVLGAAFAALAIGLPEVRQWQSERASRLHLELYAAGPDSGLAVYRDTQGVIEDWLAREERLCLASLHRRQARTRRKPQPGGTLHLDLDALGSEEGGVKDPLANITVGDLDDLEVRKAAGHELTDDEERTLAAARESIASVARVAATAFGASWLTDPDDRTPEQYRQQVARHLERSREALDEHLLWGYVSHEMGLLRLTLKNPTDRVFEAVQVEVYLPGEVRAVDPNDVFEPREGLPQRPRAFGQRKPKVDLGIANTFLPTGYIAPDFQQRGPHIDNSGSARIVFEPLLLRPHAREQLDEIQLLTCEPPGSLIEGTWEATATNAEGRITGSLALLVRAEPLPVRELLAGALEEQSE